MIPCIDSIYVNNVVRIQQDFLKVSEQLRVCQYRLKITKKAVFAVKNERDDYRILHEEQTRILDKKINREIELKQKVNRNKFFTVLVGIGGTFLGFILSSYISN